MKGLAGHLMDEFFIIHSEIPLPFLYDTFAFFTTVHGGPLNV